MKTSSRQAIFGATVTHPMGKQLLRALIQHTPHIATVVGAREAMSMEPCEHWGFHISLHWVSPMEGITQVPWHSKPHGS